MKENRTESIRLAKKKKTVGAKNRKENNICREKIIISQAT